MALARHSETGAWPCGAAGATTPALFRGLAAGYLRGVVRRGERLVVFLDVARLFATDERIVLERSAEEPARHV